MVNIRDASAADLERLFAIRAAARRAAYLPLLPQQSNRSFTIQNDVSPQNITNWQARAQQYLKNPTYIFKVAIDEHEVLGWLLARDDGPVVHLMWLFVDPRSQGQGSGSRLLAELLTRSTGRLVTLNVLEHNASIKFYERHGFQITKGEVCTYLGAPCVFMSRLA